MQKKDTTTFKFNTKLSDLKAALDSCHEELSDLCEYASPDATQKKRISDLTYWLGVWENAYPDAVRRGLEVVPTCAIENAVLNLYDKKQHKKRRKK